MRETTEKAKETSAWKAALGLGPVCPEILFAPLRIRVSLHPHLLAAAEPVLERLPFLQVHLDIPLVPPDAMAKLFAAPAMAKIRKLSFASCGDWPSSENYQSVDRRYFGDEVFVALCGSPNLAQLEALEVSDNEVGSRCASLLASAPFVALRELRIDHEPLGDEGAFMLASSPIVKTLRVLRLDDGCAISDAGASALANAPDLVNLEELRIFGTHITAVGVAALRSSPFLRARLDLTGNRDL